MCGICGVLNHSPEEPSRAVLERMVDALAHRGPNDRGVHVDGRVALGHARLSIIDLAGGRQPLLNEDGSVAVICNGEIYNFALLREELIANGHRFRTGSDCEILVHLWEEKGADLVHDLRGMFAFVLHDRNDGTLFGARDRFGQKPLFYHQDDRAFSFASEIKALLRSPDIPRRLDSFALDQYLFYQFVPQPRTMLEGIRQLPPGHRFLVRDGTLAVDSYWRPRFDPDTTLTDEEHIAQLAEALSDAVASHMVSDVPVGVFLSGGIDSSLVAALAARSSRDRLRSFSISFPSERYDESSFARTASRHIGTEHEEYAFEASHLEERLQALAATFDQPLADRAAMPLFYLSEKTAREIRVVLTGDGGDEVFAGYEKYRAASSRSLVAARLDRRFPEWFGAGSLARRRADPLRLRKMRSRLALKLLPPRQCAYFKHFWEGWDRQSLYADDLARTLNHGFEAVDSHVAPGGMLDDPLNYMLEVDQLGYLPNDLLLKTDYCTMAHGLESRAPLLDHELAARAGRLPHHLKATTTETKVTLRRVAAKLLPAELVRRPKHGFGVPLPQWFRGDLKGWLRDCLLESSTTVPHLFRRDAVERMLREHESGRKNRASKIYSLLVFELWHRHYLARRP